MCPQGQIESRIKEAFDSPWKRKASGATFLVFCGFIFWFYARPQDAWLWLVPIHVPQALLISALIIAVSSGNFSKGFQTDRLTRLVVGFFCIMCVSVVTSIWRMKTVEECQKFLPVLLPYLIMVGVVREKEKLTSLLKLIIGANFLISFVQIYVYKTIGVNSITSHGGYGLDFDRAAQGQTGFSYGVGGYVNSFLSNASDLGVGMLVVLPLAYAVMKTEPSKRNKVMLGVACISFIASVVLTGSRGAFLGLAAIIVGFSLKSKKKLRTLTIVFLLGVGLVLLAPSSYFSRIQSIEHYEEDASANIRLELWAAGLRMLLENPVLGVGVGNFPTGYGVRYHETKKGGVLWWNPHNVLIHVFSEVGFLGGIWYIMIMMAIVKNNRRIRAFARNS